MCPYGHTATFGYVSVFRKKYEKILKSLKNFFFINVKKSKKRKVSFENFFKKFYAKNKIKKIIQVYFEIMRQV